MAHGFNKTKNQINVRAVWQKATIANEDYSALFDGDADGDVDGGVIFSVEKVGVNSEEENGVPKTFAGTGSKQFYHDNDGTVYSFVDLYDTKTNKSKTVVEDGKFVVLDNIYNQVNDRYENTGNFSVENGGSVISLQEAVLVSFGAYIYDNKNEVVNIATGDTCVEMTGLDVWLYKGEAGQELLPKRTVTKTGAGGRNYYDFTYLITQDPNNYNEDYYKFVVRYMIGNIEYLKEFEFYVANKTSYTQTTGNASFGYNASPSIGWSFGDGYIKDDEVNGFVRYFIGGENGVDDGIVAYPTITYDYTKYKLHYKHTANQKNINYSYSVSYNGSKAELNCVKETNNNKTTYPAFDLGDYNAESTINLVTILLTEPGSYEINYELIYDGYRSQETPDLGIETKTLKLAIHGLSAQYSKSGFESAKMQYFKVATTKNNHVDLFIPNGYEFNSGLDNYKNQKLGFVYELAEQTIETHREGNFILAEGKDSLVNNQLKSSDKIIGEDTPYEYLPNLSGLTNEDALSFVDTNKTTLESVLNSIEYVSTNQGSIWIEGNDEFDADSFYFYSPIKISVDNLVDTKGTTDVTTDDAFNKTPFTNTTSFNQKGYYLVFIKVKPNGITDPTYEYYWQVFALQYTANATNIEIKTVESNPQVIAGGKFTNKPVTIAWKKPGIFDRDVKGYYYSVSNVNANKEHLLSTTKFPLPQVEEENGYCISTLGSEAEVRYGEFAKYLIKLESEGESATYKMFTIDRQPILGVKAYLINESHSSNAIQYSFAVDGNGGRVEIVNSITDGFATIDWANKASEAEIFASYSYTPFTAKTDTVSLMAGNSGTWLTTKYELGTTINGAQLKRAESQYDVLSDCILFNQGIYLIKIWDSAGNTCYYAFVIDRTENYFKIEDNYFANESTLYSDNVNYTIGDYKAFKLNLEATGVDSDVAEFVRLAANNNLKEFKDGLYYKGNTNNLSNQTALTKLFQEKTSGESGYYFTVSTDKVVAYNTQQKQDLNIASKTGIFQYLVGEGEGYFKRTVYAVGANHKYSTNSVYNTQGLPKNFSYVTVEINKDNALGRVYFGDSKITQEDENSILEYGSDTGGQTNGIKGAQATSKNHVAFAWTMGTGTTFEVVKVSYEHYDLKQNYQDGNYYFYQKSGDPVVLYDNGWQTTNKEELADGRVIVSINGDSISKPGLYVVKREYDSSISDSDLGDGETRVKTYYFIVDRNQIITTNIKINLMEGEQEFNSFTSTGGDAENFTYSQDGIENQSYNIYLTTTKLPATITVPAGKYFIDKNQTSANYHAGTLNVQVYFYDRYNQLNPIKQTFKIFDSNKGKIKNDGTYNINIYDYLTSVLNQTNDFSTGITNEIKNKFTALNTLNNSVEGNWIFLSGDYIIRVSDNVKDGHDVYLGLRIPGAKDLGPQVDIKTGYSQEEGDRTKVNVKKDGDFQYKATVSQEYLEVILPDYVQTNETTAQIDPNYIVVTQYYDGRSGVTYINHPYKPEYPGINLENNSKYVTKNNGSTSIWLQTKLRVDEDDPTSEIDVANLNVPLYYIVKVRYRLSPDGKSEKYKNCYVYYDNNENGIQKIYYEATYKITIDREAPKTNVEKLINADALVDDYVEEFETSSLMEINYHETNLKLYFTYQYAKYYQHVKQYQRNDNSYIYAFQVNENTKLDLNDINKIFFRKISESAGDIQSLKNHEIEYFTDETSYTSVNIDSLTIDENNCSIYSGLGALTSNCYYEIIEQDEAGNTTQYIIHYVPGVADLKVYASWKTTEGIEETGDLFTINQETGNLSYKDLSVFEIDKAESVGNVVVSNENFFKIELYNSTRRVLQILTKPTTDFATINEDIITAIKAEHHGTFTINVITRNLVEGSDTNYETKTITIGLYDPENIKIISVENLVSEDGKTINLHGANELSDDGTLLFYAKIITVSYAREGGVITDVYEAHNSRQAIIDGSGNTGTMKFVVEYKKQGETITTTTINCLENTTYHLTMVDIFGKETQHRFNSSGKEFYRINFKNPTDDTKVGEFYYQGNNAEYYYGYTTAVLEFDPIFIAKVYKYQAGVYISHNVEIPEVDGFKVVTFEANYNHGVGEYVQYKVELLDNSKIEKIYYIVLDTRTANVALRDYSTGEQRDIFTVLENKNYEDVRSNQTGSGIMNLHWYPLEENDYFSYTYRLYELMDDGNYKIGADGEIGEDLTGLTNYVISTEEESRGIYKFVISIFGKDGEKYLGNRVFAFEVQEVSTQIYYVRNNANEAVMPNSSFKGSEISGYDLNINNDYDLYITNQNLDVVITAVNVDRNSYIIRNFESDRFDLTLYKVSKENSYAIYFAILKVPTNEELVKNVNIHHKADQKETITTVNEETNLIIPGDKNSDVVITLEKTTEAENDWLKKNLLVVDVLYNGELVKTEVLQKSDNIYEHKIWGNGQYTFIFKDLAGNVHDFDARTNVENKELNLYVLREVVVTLNDQAPVANAFYNDQVVLQVYASSYYVTGSVKLTEVTRNGLAYKPQGYNPYIFSDYGTYRVKINATYQGLLLEKTLSFTIVNIKEAKQSIDLTTLRGNRITKVLNPYDQDVTEDFLNMIKENSNGMNISYSQIIDKADKFNVTAGKITFKITYSIEDGIYPKREINFGFTLNNENPSIECSLEKGGNTKKEFTINFNAAILYEQIGEAYITINDVVVAQINEHSQNVEQEIKTSFKSNGAGDYYIKLVSTSGVVWDSYKVTIKEPLNFWAVLIIIVVVAVVATIVTTIIILRRKMRIR